MMIIITWFSTSGRFKDASDTVFSREREIDLITASCARCSIRCSLGGVTRNFLGLRTFFKSTLQTLLPNRTRAGEFIEFPFLWQ